MQELAPTTDEYPARQSEHTVLPTDGVYFPAGQSVHTLEPAELEYFPTGHGVKVGWLEGCPEG